MTVKNSHIIGSFSSVSLFQPARKVSFHFDGPEDIGTISNVSTEELEGDELAKGRYEDLRESFFGYDRKENTIYFDTGKEDEDEKAGEDEKAKKKAKVDVTLNDDESITLQLIAKEGEKREGWKAGEEGKIMPDGMIENIPEDFVKKFLSCEKLKYHIQYEGTMAMETKLVVNPAIINYPPEAKDYHGSEVGRVREVREQIKKVLDKQKSA